MVDHSNINPEIKPRIKCRKFGHTGPNCPKYDPKKDKRNFDDVQYIELPLDTKVYYTEINDGKMDNSDEIFYISETPFILDSGSNCHSVTDQSLLTNVNHHLLLLKESTTH